MSEDVPGWSEKVVSKNTQVPSRGVKNWCVKKYSLGWIGLKIKLWIKNPCVKCQRVKSAHLGGLKKGGVKKYHTHLGIENDVAKNSPLG